jgi:hypothetical protein
MARVVELVNRTSCRANTASVTAAGMLVACTFTALWFFPALVRGPAAVASIALVLALCYGCVSYLAHLQEVSIDYLAHSQQENNKKRKKPNTQMETTATAWLERF